MVVLLLILLHESDDYFYFLILQSERNPEDELRKAFRIFDDDDSGKISFVNLKKVALELNENASDQDLLDMIKEADTNGDGEVDIEEFIALMRKAKLI